MTLILKNVWRQKLRTLLTLFGISIGIATILALGAVAGGLEKWFSSVLNTGEADFTIAQAQASDLAFSTIDEAALDPIRAMPEIERLDGVLLAVTPQGSVPFFFVLGVRAETAELDGLGLIEGRMFGEYADEIVLGKIAAVSMGVGVGEALELFGKPHRVAGIFETGENMKDGAGYMGLGRLQSLTQKEGKLSMALVRTTPECDIAALTARIDEHYAGTLTTIKSVDEISRVDSGDGDRQRSELATWGDLAGFRRHTVGFVFQLHNLIPTLSAWENVQVPLMEEPIPARRRQERALELLALVGLAHRADNLPTKLSGGERQRVAIARSLVNEPKILIADEPTGAVDSKNARRIMDLLRRICRERGMTLVVVTHDPSVAALAERTIRVCDGKIVDEETV